MMLEYNIIWFEDSKEYVASLQPFIEEFIKDLGFNPKITRKSNDRDLKKIMESEDVDLILIDQNLSRGSKGDILLNTIRKNELYTETVFYSQFPDFQSKISEHLEGVYYTERKNLLEKTKKIIELTVKKNLDISNIRGLFIAETIYVASQMEEIISKILKLEGESLDFFNNQIVQDEFISDMTKYKIIRRFLKQKIKNINQDIKTSTGRKKTKLNELNELKSQWEEVDNIFKKFQKEIIEFRNELAHAKKHLKKRNVLIVRDKEKSKFKERKFDTNKCKEARVCFIKHSNNLKDLVKLIGK